MKNLNFFLTILCLSQILSCSDKGSVGSFDVNFIKVDSESKGLISSFSNEGLDAKNQKFISESGLLNYLEPLTVAFKGRFSNFSEVSRYDLGPSLEFHFYTMDMNSPTGSFIRFEKSIEEQDLRVLFFNRNIEEIDICTLPLAVSKSGEFNIVIQVENDIVRSRFAIWNLYEDPSSKVYRNKDILNFRTAECSSNTLQNLVIDLFGMSSNWGLILNSVQVESAIRRAPYVL